MNGPMLGLLSAAALEMRPRPPRSRAPQHAQDAPHDSPYRGYVEALDLMRGLVGWAAHQSGSELPTITLWCDDRPLAETTLQGTRSDIWLGSKRDMPTSFAFDTDELLRIATLTDISPLASLHVRCNDREEDLPTALEWTFGDLQQLRSSTERSDFIEGEPGPLAPELRRLARKSYASLAQPLRQDPQRQSGVIEFAARLSDTHLLIGGWMRARQPTLCAMLVLSDGHKRPAALAVVAAPRPDLPEEAWAFAGVLHVADGLDLAQLQHPAQIAFAGQAQEWLCAVQPLRKPRLAEALGEAEALIARAGPAQAERGCELLALMRACLPWTPVAQRFDTLGIKIGIDHCLVIPNFGIVLSGWLLHPMSHPSMVRARLGQALYELEPGTLAFTPRKDLAASFPTMADRTATAGFSCVLRSDSKPDNLDTWMLRFDFEDHSTCLHELTLETIRCTDYQLDLASINAILPGIECMPWLDELVHSAASLLRQSRDKQMTWVKRQAMAKAIVCVLPQAQQHQLLVLEALASCLRRIAAPDLGLVILLPATMAPGTWAGWLSELRASSHPRMPLAIARLAAGAESWSLLPDLLATCTVRRFAFLGPAVLLTPAGTEAVQSHLQQASSEIDYLDIEFFKGSQAETGHESQAFAWHTAAFEAHRVQAPTLLPGYWRTNALPRPPVRSRAAAAPHCLRLSRPTSMPLHDRVNQQLILRWQQQDEGHRAAP